MGNIVYVRPVVGYIGSLAAPDQATLTEESRALQRLAAGLYNAISMQMLMAGKELGLAIDVRGEL